MDIIQKSINELSLDKINNYDIEIIYSGKFKGYNANARYTGFKITFNLSKNWKNIDKDIQVGLIQSLFCKIFKIKKNTINMDLYNNFLKSVHLSNLNPIVEPILLESFNKNNQLFFEGFMEIPNLKWGKNAIRNFGSYDYGTDTISINPVLKNYSQALDYVMYHEMLHKKFKYNTKNNRSFHHTNEFKLEENKFPNKNEIENLLKNISKKKKYGIFSNWFCFLYTKLSF
jgi:hypothetical protein